jgi:two-component system response regulator RegA
VAEGRAKAIAHPPAYAVVDLRLEDGNGLEVSKPCANAAPIAGSSC